MWKDPTDLNLLENKIKGVKRESRMGRDNSEDALSWNVFRYLEKVGIVGDFIKGTLGVPITNPEMVYWSFSQNTHSLNHNSNQESIMKSKGVFDKLADARTAFELVPAKGSEPDIIIVGDDRLVIIEAKLNAGNNTKPRNDEVATKVGAKYSSAENQWWLKVFKSDFQKVAVTDQKYEMARFWLLGTWMAEQLGVDFDLVNLVGDKSTREQDIVVRFSPHIEIGPRRKFHKLTWEQIYEYILGNASISPERQSVIDYMENKTVGYDSKGNLCKAFNIP